MYSRIHEVVLVLSAAIVLSTVYAVRYYRKPIPPFYFDLPQKYFLININKAGRDVLELLPRIGPGIAGEIENMRVGKGGFTELTNLLEVKGLSEGILNKIKNKITISD
ncbi:MAG: helix-hairpin-helix domain-containing protein [Planctomycetes bacterium]|nr:helix-hairpin-helix domain-containing protein [Planctomycetota bacterium]